MTRLVGYQPQYFPRLHYFARVLDSDIFTISDYLQYVRHHIYEHGKKRERGPSYQAHTPIKTGNGILLLDIPVRRGGTEGIQAINEAVPDYSTPWHKKHLQNIEHNYRKAPFFSQAYPSLSALLQRQYASLAQLTTGSILWGLARLFEIDSSPTHPSDMNAALPYPGFRLKRIILMSESGVPIVDKSKGYDANDWIVETCKKFGADEYHFGGTSASAYMDFSRFERAGIRLVQQNWRGPEYQQRFRGFVPNLSIIDLLMNVSPAEARDILRATSI